MCGIVGVLSFRAVDDSAELRRLLPSSRAIGGHSLQAWYLLNFVIWWEYIAGNESGCPAGVLPIEAATVSPLKRGQGISGRMNSAETPKAYRS